MKKLFAGLTVGLMMFGGVVQAENEAVYNRATGTLNIPKVVVGADSYNVEMQQQGQGLTFGVINAAPSTSSSSSNIATYNPAAGTVNIPTVTVGADNYTVDMQQQGQGLIFTVTGATVVQPNTSSASLAGQAVIDLGSYGKLIHPVQVEGHWYYYWDRSGDGTSANTGALNGGHDYVTHDTLDAIFTEDINGVTGQNAYGVGNTTDTYRYATISGVHVALPTAGGQSSPPYGVNGINDYQPGTAVADGVTINPTYNDLLAIWDANNGAGTGAGMDALPSGWAYGGYWSATPFGSGHADVALVSGNVSLNVGDVDTYYDGGDGNYHYVGLEVL